MQHQHMMNFEQKVEQLIRHYPDKLKHALKGKHSEDPMELEMFVDNALYGEHIRTLELMNKGLSTITAYTGKKAPFWSHEQFLEVCRTHNIPYENKPYTEYDLDFLAQYYGADFKAFKLDPATCILAAIDILTDHDAIGDPSEKAFKVLEHRLEHFYK